MNPLAIIKNFAPVIVIGLICVALWGLNARNSQLSATNERLEKLANSKDGQINDLRSKNDGLAASVNDLVNAVKEQNEVMGQVAKQRAATAEQNRKLQDEIKQYLAADKTLPRLFLLMLLTGCGVQQRPQVEYRTISQPRLNLPAELTSPISVPLPPDNMTYGNSVGLNIELYGVIEQCNTDRAAIRKIESGNKQ